MSNFAAMSGLASGGLSPADSDISKIIDGFSNANYALWEVSVEFGIPFPLVLLQLREMVLEDSAVGPNQVPAFCRGIPDRKAG
jgi:hypothetical protein